MARLCSVGLTSVLSAATPTGAKGRAGPSPLPAGTNFLLRKTRGAPEAPGSDFRWPGRGRGGRACGKGGGGPGWGGWKTSQSSTRQGTPRQETWATGGPPPQGQTNQHRQRVNKSALPSLCPCREARLVPGGQARSGHSGVCGRGRLGEPEQMLWGFWCGLSKVPGGRPTASCPGPGDHGCSEPARHRDVAAGASVLSAVCCCGVLA